MDKIYFLESGNVGIRLKIYKDGEELYPEDKEHKKMRHKINKLIKSKNMPFEKMNSEYLNFEAPTTIKAFTDSFIILIEFMNNYKISFTKTNFYITNGENKIGFLMILESTIKIVLVDMDGQVEKYEFEYPLPKEKLI